MEMRGWFYRIYTKEVGPFSTEREAYNEGYKQLMAQPFSFKFSTYYGYFFNYQKHTV